METLLVIVLGVLIPVIVVLKILNVISYSIIKNRVLRSRRWDLNICCGHTDGGGINADIFKHSEIPNFVQVADIYHLPFEDKAFDNILCSHTMEHVDDPEAFFQELERVGQKVTVLVPPLWDVSAALNFLEHKWVFLSMKTAHHSLPRYVRLPFAQRVHARRGQKIRA